MAQNKGAYSIRLKANVLIHLDLKHMNEFTYTKTKSLSPTLKTAFSPRLKAKELINLGLKQKSLSPRLKTKDPINLD